MKSLLFVALALLFAALGGTARAESQLGNPFCKGQNQESFAQLIEQSVARDESGNTPLDPEACGLAVPATPNQILEMIPVSDPDAGIADVSELAAYVRSLEEVAAPAGRYWSACLKNSRQSPTGWRPEANCIARDFRPGEKVLQNPKTGKIVFQGDCSNPVQLPERRADCAYIWVHTDSDVTGIRLLEAGPEELRDEECRPAILRAGEDDYESPWHDDCPQVRCDFSQVNAVLRQQGFTPQRRGSFVPQAGWQVLQVPKRVTEKDSPYLFVFCIETPQGDSCGKDIRWDDYRDGVAVIGYAPDQHPEGFRGTVRIWYFGANCMERKF